MDYKKTANDKINLEFWKKWNKELENLDADENLEFINKHPITSAMTGPLSVNTTMMKERVDIILNNCIVPPLKILKFGGGYGNFCRTYSEQASKSEFTIIDNPGMLKFVKVFLGKHNIDASLVSSSDALNIKGDFDMFVAFSSISEVNPVYRAKILKEFLPRSKSVVIGETRGEIDHWVKDTISAHFSYVHVVHKTVQQRAHYIIYASNDICVNANISFEKWPELT